MKLRSLLEIEYGVHDLLTRNRTQIEFVHGHQKFRDLQLMLSQKRDKEVEEWLRVNHHRHHAEVGGADNNNLGAIPFYEVDAEHEDEEYCPVCANKLKETIKKTVAECWKTHKQVGMKKKGGKTVPNCVPKNEVSGWDGSASKDPGMWDGKPSEKDQNFPSVGEAKTKPAKGKRFAKKVKNPKTGRTRTVSYGQAGKAKKGGDRIQPGTKKGNAYCARSAKIKKCKNPPCANALSRKKWKCQGSRSVK